jgi:hypothetical protein
VAIIIGIVSLYSLFLSFKDLTFLPEGDVLGFEILYGLLNSPKKYDSTKKFAFVDLKQAEF